MEVIIFSILSLENQSKCNKKTRYKICCYRKFYHNSDSDSLLPLLTPILSLYSDRVNPLNFQWIMVCTTQWSH